MAVLKSARELREDLQELTREARSIQDTVEEKSGGVFSEPEQARFEALTGEGENGEGGLIKEAQDALERRIAMDNKREQLIALETKTLTPAYQGGLNSPEPVARTGNRLPDLRKHRCSAFDNTDEGRKEAYLSGMWLRAMLAKWRNDHDDQALVKINGTQFDPRAQQVVGTDADGGYLVPKPLDQAIINYRDLSGITKPLCQNKTMTANTLWVDKKIARTTVQYPGEATAITESKQQWSQIELKAVKRAVLVRVSQELNDDAIISVMDDIAQEMGSDLAIQMDEEFIQGDGNGVPSSMGGVDGLKSRITNDGQAGLYTLAATNTSFDDVTLTDITNLMAMLPDKFHVRNPVFVTSTKFYWQVMAKLLAEAGGNFIATLEGGPRGAGEGVGPSATFMGYPVWFTQWADADAAGNVPVYFGSMYAAALFGERIGVRIAQSEHRYFEEDVLAIRATSRYDIQVHEYGDNSSAIGAFVALQLAAA